MRIIVVGATSEIAQSCCHLWAAQGGHDFVLSGRNQDKLRYVAQDLEIRYPESKFAIEDFDHLDVSKIQSFVKVASRKSVDLVLIAHGSLTSQPKASSNVDYLWRELETNAVSPIVFAESWAGVLARQGHGNLAVIGSVAGDRGRAINHGYGSAKAAIEVYLSGLQHRFAGSGVKVSLIKPGPTKTPMTTRAHIGPTKLTDPKVVARQIVRGLHRDKRIIYAPKRWRWIMFAIKVLPFQVFRKLKF